MDIKELFRKQGQQLYWGSIPAEKVASRTRSIEFKEDEAYLIVRIQEMFLKTTRVLWRKSYPMLHGYFSHHGFEQHTVAGPGQLREFGEGDLERVVNLRYRVFGPTPFKAADLVMLIGLYAIPAADAAKALIETVSRVASLGGLAVGGAVQIADVVKSGVESVLGIEQAKLQLGVRYEFSPDQPLRSGYFLGVNAPIAEVNVGQLWLSPQGRLVYGEDLSTAVPYQAHDYIVLQVEHRIARDDWASLPDIAPFNQQFAAILGDNGTDIKAKREKLSTVWSAFSNALRECIQLTRVDRERIAKLVADDLRARVAAMETGVLFETRTAVGRSVDDAGPDYDFINIADVNPLRVVAGSGSELDRNLF